MKMTGTTFFVSVSCGVAVASALPTLAQDELYWVGYQADCVPTLTVFDSSFHHGDNWLGFATPTASDTVIFGSGVNPDGRFIQPNVYFGDFCFDVFPCPPGFIIPAATATSARLVVQDGRYTFDFGPGFIPSGSCALDVRDSGGYQIVGDIEPLIIGATIDTSGLPGDASLTLEGGRLDARFARIASETRTFGRLTIRGASAEAHFFEFPDIGYLGDGEVLVEQGGLLSSDGWITVGVHEDARGLLQVSGANSRVFAADWIDVGYIEGSEGIMRVSAGATVDARIPVAGSFPGSIGEISVSGTGSMLVGREQILIGREASGTLLLTNSSEATTPLAIIGNLESASGRVVIDADARLTALGNLIIGNFGTGDVRVGAGGILRSEPIASGIGRLSIGEQPGASGTLAIVGDGAILTHVGDLYGGLNGRGSIEVANGGHLRMTDVDGRGGSLIVADGAGAEGSLAVQGASTLCESTTQAQIGRGGLGTLQVLDGATLRTGKLLSPTNSSGIVGTNSSGVGDAVISGTSSAWIQDGAMSVGFGGAGTLAIVRGGTVQSQIGHVARFGASQGLVEIRDRGSQWRIVEEFYLGGNEAGASRGQATLRVSDGGQLIAGGVTLLANGHLEVVVAPGLPPMIDSAGLVSLAGRVEIVLDPGYEPTSGDRVQIIAARSLLGAFDEVALPLTGSGLSPRLVTDDSGVHVVFACRADLDGDGVLTIFDFLAFQNAFAAMDPIADFDGDGQFTIFDFLAFQNAFDAGCP